jgi:predicted outer membrane repeat protein
VTHSVFRYNTASYEGGGIYLHGDDDGTLTATDDVFTGNTAEGGGGIYNYDGAVLTGDTFTGNSASVGGGVENEFYATVTNSVFRQNKATTNAGGFYNDWVASLSGAVFNRNTAGADGGAIWSSRGPTPGQAITGSQITVTRNTASEDGGGIYASAGTTIALTQSTIKNNQPDNCAPASSVAGCTG